MTVESDDGKGKVGGKVDENIRGRILVIFQLRVKGQRKGYWQALLRVIEAK